MRAQIDALYEKVREGKHVVSKAVLIAYGVSALGVREVIGVEVADGEMEDSWRRFLAGLVERGLRGVKLCAIGAGTAERFSRFGIKVDLMPAESRAESVVQALLETGSVEGLRILLPRADIGREVIGEELRRRGAQAIARIRKSCMPRRPAGSRP